MAIALAIRGSVSRLRAQIAGSIVIALCALQKSSRSLFVIMRNGCNCSTRSQQAHHGCSCELTALSQSRLQLRNTSQSHLETRGIHCDSFLRGRGYKAIALARSR